MHTYKITIYIIDYSLFAFPLTFYFICLTYPSRSCALHHHFLTVFCGNYVMHSVNFVYKDDKISIVFPKISQTQVYVEYYYSDLTNKIFVFMHRSLS